MNATHLRVGLMLVASLALGVVLVLFLGRNRVSDGPRFETYFRETVQGMDVGSPVRFRGVQLGNVTEIALAAAAYPHGAMSVLDPDNRLVVVRFAVDPAKLGRVLRTAEAVAAGLRVRLAAQGITGLAYLELDFVDPARFPGLRPDLWTPPGNFVPSMPSTIRQFQDAAQQLAEKLQTVDLERLAEKVELLLDKAAHQLDGGDLGRMLAEARQLVATLNAAATMADVPGLATDLRETLAGLRGLTSGQQSRDLVAATARSAERLGETVARLPALIASLEGAVRRVNNSTADAQAELLPALRDARAAAASLRDTSEALRRYPASVLSAPPPRERQ